jgi:acyl-CoA synthetase (AMP-forming)/AMP-acid ligase II
MVVAEAVPQQGASIDVTALATYLSEKLSRYKLPSALRLVDSIERTDSGKIRRVAQG